MTEIRFFNTLSREKEKFVPINPNRVTLYVCGPTVYDRAHIGNARPAVVFDTLSRFLRHIYGENSVIYARNITDIDDKINKAANEAGVEISAITKKYTALYHFDMGLLNVRLPDIEPRVTTHLGEIIKMIKKLMAENHAYQTEDGVYFDTASMKDYGHLSRRNLDDMIMGARIGVDEKKKNPADFALWKSAKEGEVFWQSPFGNGRPGWHIECSAMIEKNLGLTIDIHGGGHDLIFPHHENEIAQSQCAHSGTKLANYWLHNGFLNFGEEKMSKSLGNVLNIEEICAKFKPEAVRFAMLSAHYRAPLDWNDDLIIQSQKTLDRIYRAIENIWSENISPIIPSEIIEALADDLNTPQALAVLSELVRGANKAQSPSERHEILAKLLGAGKMLGILLLPPSEWFRKNEIDENLRIKLDALLKARKIARDEKNWARADEIRAEFAEYGFEVLDTQAGSEWRKKS